MKHSIIPIFIPHQGCPHRCVFCNQVKITGVTTSVTPADVERTIVDALTVCGEAMPEVAFYGGSFTALPKELQHSLLQPAYQWLCKGKIHSIRLSTRPDYINESIVADLQSLGVGTIELGAQSLDDKVLAFAERGHSYQDITTAVRVIRQAGLACGLQLMVGLPGEDWTSLIRSAERVIDVKPDFIRIYPTIVISGTALADLWLKGCYQPLGLESAIARCAFLKLLFHYRHQLPIIRIGLQASEGLNEPGHILAGPYHPSFGELVDSYIFDLMAAKVFENDTASAVAIYYHPADHSKLRGMRNKNLSAWKARYHINQLTLAPSGTKPNEIRVVIGRKRYIVHPQMIFTI